VQALIQLARLQGSKEIFVTAPLEQHELLRKQGAAALNENGEWLSFIANTMDIVVDMNFPTNFSTTRSVVKPKGYLICNQKPKEKDSQGFWSCAPSVPAELDYFLERTQLCVLNCHASLFDYSDYVTEFRQEVFEDMNFLLDLLSARRIRPKIDRFIALRDIPDAHMELEENKGMAGAIICEPWKR
jgi:NADPH:quinone reductase-like Zn-dependent oxidoreductase